MREPKIGGSSAQEPVAPDAGADAHTTRSKDSQDQEYLTVASKGRDVRRTTCLLAVLFGMGLLGLLLMIKKSTPRSATASSTQSAETDIEAAMARLTGIKAKIFDRMDEIVNRFYEFSDVRQVKVNELVRNPFEHDLSWSTLKRAPNSDRSNAEAERLLREQQLRKQAKGLRLLSIMRSKQGNCCMIDDKILYEGDTIKAFTIRKIEDSRVTLMSNETESENVEILLKLSQ
jgi:hypothetical protein